MESVKAAFVILSDLHFGHFLEENAEDPMQDLLRNLNNFPDFRPVSSLIKDRCLGHSRHCIIQLARYLKILISRLKQQGYDRETFDLYSLLGDQVTVPDDQSYKFLYEYLTTWLDISQSKLLAVPGNHDKLFKANLDLYNRKFVDRLNEWLEQRRTDVDPWQIALIETEPALGELVSAVRNEPSASTIREEQKQSQEWDKCGIEEQSKMRPRSSPEIPEFSPERRCVIAKRRFGNREFLFVIVEASIYTESKEDVLDFSFRRHLAQGEITCALDSRVKSELEALKTNGRLGDLVLEKSYAEVFKIMLIHYAVDYDRVLSELPRPQRIAEKIMNKGIPHECKQLGKFVSELQTHFQLIIHGHLHVFCPYTQGLVPVISATTATQAKKQEKYKDGNGFFVLKVWDTGRIEAEHHVWKGAFFERDPVPSHKWESRFPQVA